MRRIGLFSASVLLFLATVAIAQSGNPGGMTSTQFQTGSWADAGSYYFAVRYSGSLVPDVQARVVGRMLEISIGQASNLPGGFLQNQMSQRYLLPMDADPSRMSRYDRPGYVLIMIPRRSMGYPRRW